MFYLLTHAVSHAAAPTPRRRDGRLLVLTASVTVIALTQIVLLPGRVLAQTPTSSIYAFTNLHDQTMVGQSYYSFASDVENGVVVGVASGINTNNRLTSFRWNGNGTTSVLPTPTYLGSGVDSSLSAISGGVIVGSGSGSNTNSRLNALRWNMDGTVTSLHSLANLGTDSLSNAFDIDAGVAVGIGIGSNTTGHINAFRWNADGTVTNLHAQTNLGTDANSAAYAISDGVTVGTTYLTLNNPVFNAVRWNANGTVTDLHSLTNLGTNASSEANGVDGGITVGYGRGSNTNDLFNALRWNSDGTVTSLHSTTNLGFNSSSLASDIASGVVVGQGSGSLTDYNSNALLWNADGTSVNLHKFVNGILNSTATAIDANTGIIVGSIYRYVDDESSIEAAQWTPLNAGIGGANALTVQSGVHTTINQDFTQSAGLTNVNGRLTVDDANIANGVETFALAGGILSGAGTVTGNLANTGGTVSPGNSPETLSIDGNYVQGDAGVLKIEIASLSDFDVLNILGNATLDGTLDIHFIDSYVPSLDSLSVDFMYIDGSLAGMFDTIHVTGGDFVERGVAGQVKTISNGDGYKLALVAVVVPEAGTMALLGLAVPLLGTWIARRRNK